MHQLHHRGMARALKLSAFFFIIRVILFCTFMGTLFFLVVFEDQRAFYPLAISFGVGIIASIFSFCYGNKARCQLCQTTLILHQKCVKSPNAKRTLGSYRLKLSLSVIFTSKFTCPYCGESFTTQIFDLANKKTITDPIRTNQNRPVSSLRQSGSIPQRHK